MKLQALDIAIILIYMASVIVIGIVLQKKARSNKKEYLLGGNSLPWYLLGLSNASGYVRHFGHDVDGDAHVCLWHEKRLDSLAVAGFQPGVSDDVPLGVVAAIGRIDRGRVDGDAFWEGARC